MPPRLHIVEDGTLFPVPDANVALRARKPYLVPEAERVAVLRFGIRAIPFVKIEVDHVAVVQLARKGGDAEVIEGVPPMHDGEAEPLFADGFSCIWCIEVEVGALSLPRRIIAIGDSLFFPLSFKRTQSLRHEACEKIRELPPPDLAWHRYALLASDRFLPTFTCVRDVPDVFVPKTEVAPVGTLALRVNYLACKDMMTTQNNEDFLMEMFGRNHALLTGLAGAGAGTGARARSPPPTSPPASPPTLPRCAAAPARANSGDTVMARDIGAPGARRKAGSRTTLTSLSTDVLSHIATRLLVEAPECACALRECSRHLKQAVDDAMVYALAAADALLSQLLACGSIVEMAALAGDMEAMKIDPLKLLCRREQKRAAGNPDWHPRDYAGVRRTTLGAGLENVAPTDVRKRKRRFF